jgi:hypothetical protein
MSAEAIIATEGPSSKAVAYVNAVRSRAKLPVLTSIQSASAASFLTVIIKERRTEFMFEGLRWFDLVRWGDFVPVMTRFLNKADEGNSRYSINVQPFRSLFAIPQGEIDRNVNVSVMWQNPGY